MGEPNRYFVNNLSDGETINVQQMVELQKERAQSLSKTVIDKLGTQLRNGDCTLYVGLSGVSYMLLHLSEVSAFKEDAKRLLEKGLSFLQFPLEDATTHSKEKHITDRTGFLTGDVGVYAVAIVVYTKLGMMKEASECVCRFKEAAELVMPLGWYQNGGDEMFVGRAGVLCAVVWIRSMIRDQPVLPDAQLDHLLDTMIESGLNYSKSVKSSFPLMYHYYGVEYLGPAHGISGILYIMLCFPDWMNRNEKRKRLIKDSIDALLCVQSSNGNFPDSAKERGGWSRRMPEDELVHWCHGAPGVIYLMAKAFLVFKENEYLESCLRCGEITWQKGLLKKGPGICHGVAGSGYVFLVLYQLTRDPKHLRRAHQFMNFLSSAEMNRARTPDMPFSLYEGIAGTACFAADLTEPLNASFPFLRVV